MNKKLYIANLISNAVITALFLVAVIYMFFVPLPGDSALMDNQRWMMFRYFTIDSNYIMGISAIISLVYLIIYKGKKYPTWVGILKITGVTGVFITFLVTFTMLGPLYGYAKMIEHVSLYMHLLIPVISVATLMLFEPRVDIKFRWTPLFVVPLFVYGLFYMINVYVNNGFGNVNYDWYAFGAGGPVISIFVFLGVLLVGYGLSLALYFALKKFKGIFNKEKEA